MSTAELASLVGRLETITSKLERVADRQGSPFTGRDEPVVPYVQAYDAILHSSLKNFLNLSAKVGKEVYTQAGLVEKAFSAQRKFLVVVSRSKEPSQNVLVSLLKPTSEQIQAIQDFRQQNRTCTFFNHLSSISEAISSLGWVTVMPAPAPFIKEMLDAGQFYTNRVLVEYKDKDKIHSDWVRAWLQVLTELQAYVKEHHLTGLTWNPYGRDVSSSPMAAVSPMGHGAPPPPPPPPAALFQDLAPQDPRAALFKELNQGEDITKSLKRVTNEQQTHKNPNLRAAAPAPFKGPATAPRPFKPYNATQGTANQIARPPKLELDGKKWRIENQQGNHNIVIAETEMNQSVCIYQCQDSVLTVKGKINSITVDSCKKMSVVFEDIVSCVEFINCQSVKAQSLHKVPTISIDKTDGAQIFLSLSSLDAEIVTSKSSEINVCVVKPDGDYTEHPVPEQFKSVWAGKGLKTEPVEKA